MIHDADVPLMCCGQNMIYLELGTTEVSAEKHISVVTVECDTLRVNIGFVAHTMTEAHSILWIYLQTDRGGQRKCITTDFIICCNFCTS